MLVSIYLPKKGGHLTYIHHHLGTIESPLYMRYIPSQVNISLSNFVISNSLSLMTIPILYNCFHNKSREKNTFIFSVLSMTYESDFWIFSEGEEVFEQNRTGDLQSDSAVVPGDLNSHDHTVFRF